MELALARLSVQTNLQMAGTIVNRILNLVESGQQTFTVDELFSNVVQVAVDFSDKQQTREQAAWSNALLADLFDTPNEVNVLAQSEELEVTGLRFPDTAVAEGQVLR
jgi:hypothetical protein